MPLTTLVSNVKLLCNFCTLQSILISINIFSFIQHFKDVPCIDNKLKIFQFVGLWASYSITFRTSLPLFVSPSTMLK